MSTLSGVPSERIEPDGRVARRRYHSLHKLPSEALSVDSALKILREITRASRKGGEEYVPVTTDEVIKATGAGRREDISRCLPFFAEAGLVVQDAKGRPYRPTADAVSYTNALALDTLAAKAALRRAFSGQWFASIVRNAFEETNEASRRDMAIRLGKAAGVDLEGSPQVEEKLTRLIDFLVHCEFLLEDAKSAKLTLPEGRDVTKDVKPLNGGQPKPKDANKEESGGQRKKKDDGEDTKRRTMSEKEWSLPGGSAIRVEVISSEPLGMDDLVLVAKVYDQIKSVLPSKPE